VLVTTAAKSHEILVGPLEIKYVEVHHFLCQLNVVFINTNIKGASPTCFGTGVPSSGRTKCQF